MMMIKTKRGKKDRENDIFVQVLFQYNFYLRYVPMFTERITRELFLTTDIAK